MPAPASSTLRLLSTRQRTTLYLRRVEDRLEILKVLERAHPTEQELRRFLNAYEVARGLDLPGVRVPRAVERFERRPALVLPYVEGRPLGEAITEGGLPLPTFLALAVAMARAVASVHGAGVIHRDVKPANFILRPDGTPVLIDFGLATRLGARMHYLGNPQGLRGTLAYVSPEQTGRMNRIVDHRSDIYSLGVTFYEMLCGGPPFSGDRATDLVHAHLARPPPPLASRRPDVPEVVARIVHRMLVKDPDGRYQGLAGVIHDLDRCLRAVRERGRPDDFAIGEHDLPNRFQLPQRLYGREEDAARLVAAFDRASRSRAAFLLVEGEPGVGKSALVRELHRPVSERAGRMAEGKFDQVQAAPYQGFAQAIEELAALLLGAPAGEMDAIRSALQEALGELAGLLAGFGPHLARLLEDPPPPGPAASASDERERFQYAVIRFLGTLASERHPLVLFLDDLQWADPASVELVEAILGDPSVRHLLVVGACRPGEVGETHPLRLALDHLAARGIAVERIAVEPLEPGDVRALVGDALHRPPETVVPLADRVYATTRGNPFFVRQFLLAMARDDAIWLDHVEGCWRWDIGRTDAADLPEDIVELVARRASRLPEATVEVLTRAACMRNRFDLATLARVCERPVEELRKLLWPALEEGFAVPCSANLLEIGAETGMDAYRFAHDRVQQALVSLVPEDQRPAVHHRIGRLLLERLPRKERDATLLDVVGQLNLGAAMVTTDEERRELAKLNLEAGRMAMASAAYRAALDYLETGAGILPEDAWSRCPTLCLELQAARCDAALLAGPDEEALTESAEAVIAHAPHPADAISVHDALLQFALQRQDYIGGTRAGLRALESLGVRFPRRPTLLHVIASVLRIKLALRGKTVEDLARRPEVSDPRTVATLVLMERMCPAAFRVPGLLFPLLTLRLLEMSLAHGNSPSSVFAYAAYAITNAGVLGDFDAAERFGKLAMEVADRIHSASARTKALFIYNCFIRHWTEPLVRCADGMREGYLEGLRAGSIYEAVWSAFYRICWMFHSTSTIPAMLAELDAHAELFARDEAVCTNARFLRQLVVNLQDTRSEDAWRLAGEHCDPVRAVEVMERGRDHTNLCTFHLYAAQLASTYEHHETALEHLEAANRVVEAITAMPLVPILVFREAVIRALAARAGVKGARACPVLRRAIRRMRRWAALGSGDHDHRLALLEAELASLRGRHAEAEAAYDRAIVHAARSGILQEEALCLELAARHHVARGRTPAARMYLAEALRAYRGWGADGKVRSLQATFPEHVRLFQAPGATSPTTSSSRAPPSATTSSDHLDLASVAEAAAAISEEIVFDRLVAALLRVVVGNAGAQRGVLLLREAEGLRLEAVSEEGEVTISGGVPLEDDAPLARSIVDYCLRSHREVVLEDACREGPYQQDDHVARNGVRSVLCCPILRAGELLGIVYLENNLLPAAFPPERVRAVTLLAGQAATSLRNARLYERLRQAHDEQRAMAEAATRFVPHQFLRVLGREDLREVRLGDSSRRDMTILFSDIRGFTTLAERYETSRELVAFLNAYLSFVEPAIRDCGGFIDSFTGDGILALFPDADDGLAATVAVHLALDRFNRERRDQGAPPVRTGIGVSSGPIMMGTVGGPGRFACTVIGDTANTASRVESLTKHFSVRALVTHHTVRRLRRTPRPLLRPLGAVRAVGKSHAVELYQVVDAEPDPVREAVLASLDTWLEARRRFEEGAFVPAIRLLDACLERSPDDPVPSMLRDRCRGLVAHPPREPWDPTLVLDRK